MASKHQLKPTGTWEVLRRIWVPALSSTKNSHRVEKVINELSGVNEIAVEVNAQKLWVLYDASQVNYQEIVEVLTGVGYPPADNWWTRFKGGIYQYSDTNARDNAKAPPPACCNKSPK
jgi:copper chaperone CopZ